MAIPDESDFSCLHPTARVKFDGGKQAVVCDSCHMIVTYLGGDAVRVAELEAVIQKALDVEDQHPDTAFYVIVGHMRAALLEAPSVVPGERDRKVRAAELEEAGQQIIEALDTHYLVDDRNLGYYRTEVTCACGESWWYGEHDGDPRRWEMWDKHRVSVIAALRSSSPYRADQIGEQP